MHAGDAPLFLLSFRQRDELTAMSERCGWAAVGARRAEAAVRRFIGSGACVAVVDARGAFSDGLAAIKLLADAVQANGGALLALLSRGDIARLDEVHAAGATHYLASPFGEAEYGQALRFAERHAERVGARYRVSSGPGEDLLGWRWRPGTGRMILSPALARLIGAPPGDHPLSILARQLGAPGLRAARAALAGVVSSGDPSAFAHDGAGARMVHHVQLSGEDVIGRVEELEERGHRLPAASRDPLTGLADSGVAGRWLAQALRLPPEGAGCALLLVSVGRLEMINTTYGRPAGDALLRVVARRIERLALKPRRLVARIAGAEFLVGVPAPAALEEMALLARALVDAVSRPFVVGEAMVALTGHVGIAIAEPADRDPAALLRRASGALAEAREGDGPVRLMSAREEDAAVAAARLELDLRAALDEGQIEILYQPQIAVSTGRIVGVEALARWRHPRLGELGAEALFAAAERSGYLLPLSQHVQRQVVREAIAWPPVLSELRISINVTPPEVAQLDFAVGFLAMIDEAGLARHRLTLEVTESSLIDDLEGSLRAASRLRAAGLSVAIDDFGTGYSSLAYLKALPLDYLKIDRRLSQDIVGSVRDRVVVRGVIDMARSLGLAVIAEGVETTEQLALLAEEGCNLYQGFIFAPPLDTAALVTMVGGWQSAEQAA